jgi:hypothetical protein
MGVSRRAWARTGSEQLRIRIDQLGEIVLHERQDSVGHGLQLALDVVVDGVRNAEDYR